MPDTYKCISELCGIMHTDSDNGVQVLITKRMVGITLALLGLVAIGGVVAVDLVGAGKWSGLGPAQQLAIVASTIICLVGLSLIPLGDKPA